MTPRSTVLTHLTLTHQGEPRPLIDDQILVVPHDEDFVQRIGLSSENDVTARRGLTDPPASGG